MDFPSLPSFYEDPYFMGGQKQLQGIGTDFLAGKIPDYYKPIGESGGPLFEDMLRLNTEDITRTGYESAARMGTRGGATQSNILKNVRSMAAPLRWADFTRSLQGRQGFLDKGISAVSGVRDAGLNFGGQRNTFNQNNARMEQSNYQFQLEREAAKKASKDKMWSDIISGVMGGLGTAAGGFLGGPGGAMLGSKLFGSAAKGTATVSASNPFGGGTDNLDFFGSRGGENLYGFKPNSLDYNF